MLGAAGIEQVRPGARAVGRAGEGPRGHARAYHVDALPRYREAAGGVARRELGDRQHRGRDAQKLRPDRPAPRRAALGDRPGERDDVEERRRAQDVGALQDAGQHGGHRELELEGRADVVDGRPLAVADEAGVGDRHGEDRRAGVETGVGHCGIDEAVHSHVVAGGQGLRVLARPARDPALRVEGALRPAQVVEDPERGRAHSPGRRAATSATPTSPRGSSGSPASQVTRSTRHAAEKVTMSRPWSSSRTPSPS